MSSRRSRAGQSNLSRITDEQTNDLITKLQTLGVPEIRNRNPDKVSASKVLQEACHYIRSLHREVDELSEKLSGLLASADGEQAAVLRSLLQ